MKKKPKSWRLLPKAGNGIITKPVPDSLQVESARVNPPTNLKIDTNTNNELAQKQLEAWRQTPEGQRDAARWHPSLATDAATAGFTGAALAAHAGVFTAPAGLAPSTAAAAIDARNAVMYGIDAVKNKDWTQAGNAAMSAVYAGLDYLPELRLPGILQKGEEAVKLAKTATSAQREYHALSAPFHGDHTGEEAKVLPVNQVASAVEDINEKNKTGLQWARREFGGKILTPKPLLPNKNGGKVAKNGWKILT